MKSFCEKKHCIAITGANGFVGSNLALRFLDDGHKVKAFIRENADLSLWKSLGLDSHCGNGDKNDLFLPIPLDYNDKDTFLIAMQDCDILIHNAAITKGKGWKDFRKHNIELTDTIVEVVNTSESVKHLIFISSQAAAGACEYPKKETDTCSPISHYGKSKQIAEQLIRTKCRKEWTILRPCSVYGSGDRDFLQYFKMINKGISLIVGWQKRYISLIAVEDLADYISKTVNNPVTFQQVMFLSDGQQYSWDDFIDSLSGAMNKKPFKLRLPAFVVIPVALAAELTGLLTKRVPLVNWQKSKEIRACHWICDSSKLESLLSVPLHRTDLKSNLRKTYEWYKEKQWL